VSFDSKQQLEHLHDAARTAGLSVDVVLPIEHHALLGNMRIHYLDWAGPSRPSVIFLHGGGLTAHTWDLTCLGLRARFRCIAPDLRGHGESEWSPSLQYGIDSYVADLENLVATLQPASFALVGMSLGGLVALAYAASRREALKALVIVDVGPQTRAAGVKRIVDFMTLPDELDSVEAYVERALAFNPARDARLLRQSLLHNLHQLPNGKWTWKYDRRLRSPSDLGSADLSHLDLRDEVKRITCPTLVVRGARSDVFSDEDAASLVAGLPDGRWIKIQRAGHTVQGDNPKDLTAALIRFLRPRLREPQAS
jgi:pimeloyl-ACP methyl ester carboxylesterase